jgi:HD-GYP domain-containing protein (c-di-GMP phosphodiesterase class II)
MASDRISRLKSLYTARHAKRAVYYAARISEELKLPEEKIEVIKQAAMLHDLGKAGIDDKILRKRSKLSVEEFEEVKKHPRIAADTIRPIYSLYPVIPLLLYDHERWDGKGYPYGLAGESIPLEARVISVVDVYQALVSGRPYRRAYAKEKAITIIKEASGTQFDPDIVNSFLKVLQAER